MLRTVAKLSALILLSFLSTACAPGGKEPSSSETNTLSVESPEFAQYVYERAREKRLKVALIDETKIRFMSEEAERVHLLVREAAEDFLPIGRSIQQPHLLPGAFERQLEEAGIPFRKVVHNGDTWLVWEESDAERARTIVQKVEMDYAQGHYDENEDVQPSVR